MVRDGPSIAQLSFRAALLFALVFHPSFFTVQLFLLQYQLT
jgi:hypothetical protein